MATVEEQCCAPGVLGHSGNPGLQQWDYATSCLDFFNHEFVIAATDLRSGTRCPLDDGDPLTNEVRSLGVGWLGCTVRVGYPDADRSASGTV